jgi:DNA polymerase-3 subunit gamma/tau
MSEYLVTARKWRPMKFEDVVGQEHVTVTLRNAIAANRLAHAYLFSGPRGVGKTTTARLLAKAVNCLQPRDNNPDNECEICREITEGRSFDVLEIDGASNRGVEEIRNLRESVRYTPTKGKYKVYIIDEVHMLTKEAFNALLKTLEEPPSHILFIFATTEIHKVPATIVSRCQRFDFRRISIDEIIANLKAIAHEEGLKIDDDSLLLIAKKGDGSLRDSQSMFDQVVSLCGTSIAHAQILQSLNIVDQEIFFRCTDLIKAKDAKGGLELVEEINRRGYDIKEFLAGLNEHLRNILIAKTTNSTALIEASDVHKKRYAEEARAFSIADILRLQRLVNGTESAVRWSTQPRFKLEADFIQMITMPGAADVGELVQRIDDLKKKLNDGEFQRKASPVTPAVSSRNSHGGEERQPPLTQPQSSVSFSGKPASTAAPSPALSEEEVRTRWPEFINEVRQQRISLGSVLESSTLLGISRGTMRIGCGNEFQAASIKRNKVLLGEIIKTVFNLHLQPEAEINGNYQRRVAPASGLPPQEQTPQDEHPVIKALMKELGAEPME